MTSSAAEDRSAWFTEARLGMFIHWGLYAQAARHEWVMQYERITVEDYQKYFEHFDPDRYDPREWARQARAAGMRYVVITTKHHEGFCLFDSAHTEYKAPNTPCRRDLLREFVDAFRAEGLRIGFYYSLLDWHHPEFTVDRIHPQRDDAEYREATQDRDMTRYAAYMRDQLRELLTNYGPVDVLWLDYSYPGKDGKGHKDWESEKLLALVRELSPHTLVNNRLDLPGHGDFVTPEQYVPDQPPTDDDGNPRVWEACQTFSGSWGYFRDEASWKSVPMLIGMLIDHVSKGGNLLLNVGPTARGDFDARAQERLAGLGAWMDRNERSIRGCGPAPDDLQAPPDCRYTYDAQQNRLYLHFLAWPFKSIHLPGLAGRLEYAQLLHDASEIRYRESEAAIHEMLNARTPEGAVTLEIPVAPPPGGPAVVELFLKP